MNRIDRLAPRAILMASLVAIAGTAMADHSTDDAGSGRDAGNTKDAAMVLAGYGAYTGYLGPRDWDWFRVDAPTLGPRCIQVDASGDNNDTVRLGVDSPDRTRTLTGKFPAGGSTTLAIAAPSVTRTHFDITASGNLPGSGDPARPGHYDFNLREVRVPAANVGDAFTGGDAGNEIGKATPLTAACSGGRIDPVRTLGDTRDVYSVTVGHGQALTYSFAVANDPGALTLALVDASGAAVGPTLRSGEMASLALPAGTYYLNIAATSITIDDVGYVLGIVLGPPESGCRPQC